MGLLDSLERGIEKAVRGAFAGRGGNLGPVEIATAVRRHMDRETRTVDGGRTLVPNLYKIRLSDDDFSEAKKYGVALAEELCEEIIRHADSQGYTLLGPVKTTFVKNTELKRGQLSIESLSDRDVELAGAASERKDASPAAGATAAVPLPNAPARSSVQVSPPAGCLEVNGQRHRLTEATTVVGRSTSADITLEDTGVSRKHLEVVLVGGQYYARDLGSTNGSYVDGEKLAGQGRQAALHDGALISLGNARLRFYTG